MRFVSNSFSVGPYEFQSVIGNGQSSRAPLALPSVYPEIESFYRTVTRPRTFTTLRALFSLQLGQEIPYGLDLRVSVYRRAPLIDSKVVSASRDDAPLEVVAGATIRLEPKLAVWEDVGTQRRYQWRMSRTQEIDLRVNTCDRLLVVVSHQDMNLPHVCAEVILE
jgi:hypothetical protein